MRKSKILKKRNPFGREWFVALVQFKLFWIIPVWLSVKYRPEVKDVYYIWSGVLTHELDSFQEAEQAIEKYLFFRSGKTITKKVARKTKNEKV